MTFRVGDRVVVLPGSEMDDHLITRAYPMSVMAGMYGHITNTNLPHGDRKMLVVKLEGTTDNIPRHRYLYDEWGFHPHEVEHAD